MTFSVVRSADTLRHSANKEEVHRLRAESLFLSLQGQQSSSMTNVDLGRKSRIRSLRSLLLFAYVSVSATLTRTHFVRRVALLDRPTSFTPYTLRRFTPSLLRLHCRLSPFARRKKMTRPPLFTPLCKLRVRRPSSFSLYRYVLPTFLSSLRRNERKVGAFACLV